jgi:UDP-N-acetylmuramoyl-L-alanyl-D-glutamate--2,6-diaminopimelate ligase
VLGCVGYSDKDKRIEMGDVVARYSDKIVFTSDNPGCTPFTDICDDVIIGFGNSSFICIEDRFTAIKYAYNLMDDGDILVLIGKGAEDFQKIGNDRMPYSDKESINKILESEDK